MDKTNSRRLIKLAVLLFIITAECVLPFWITPGWISLASGFIGSIALIIPPMRIEIAKAGRTKLRKRGTPYSPALAEYRKEIETDLTRSIEEEHEWDAFLLVIGGVMLAFYFVLQIPYKMELVDRNELSDALAKFKLEQIDPIRVGPRR